MRSIQALKREFGAGVGSTHAPKHDLHRYVRWPKYVRIQRQRRVLNQRLKVCSCSASVSVCTFLCQHRECCKWWRRRELRIGVVLQVPPALNRFTKTADKNLAETVFKLLLKYRPEDKAAKKARLLREVRCWGHSLECWIRRKKQGDRSKGLLVCVRGSSEHATTTLLPPDCCWRGIKTASCCPTWQICTGFCTHCGSKASSEIRYHAWHRRRRVRLARRLRRRSRWWSSLG